MGKLTKIEMDTITDLLMFTHLDLNQINQGIDPYNGSRITTKGTHEIAKIPPHGCVDCTIVDVVEEFVGANDILIDITCEGSSLLSDLKKYSGTSERSINLVVSGSTENLTSGKIKIAFRIIEL